MIQQLPGKTIIFFLVLIGIAFPGKSQNKTKKNTPDTIVVYETQIVYDTLFIYDTIHIPKFIKNNPINAREFVDTLSGTTILHHDSLSTNDTIFPDKIKEKTHYISQQLKPLPYKPLPSLCKPYSVQIEDFFCKMPATKLKKSIISLKSNKKLMTSERYSTTNSRQYSSGISTGGGGWWARSSDGNLRTRILFSPHVGVFFEKKIARNFSLSIELNYKWIAKKGIQFIQDNYLDSLQPASTPGIKESDIFSWDVDGINEDDFRFSQIDIPLKMGYKFGFFQPYVGFEYTRRFKLNNLNNGNYFNLIAGAKIHLSSRLSLELSYSTGIRDEIQRNGEAKGIIVGNIIVLPESKVAFSNYLPAEYLGKNIGALSSRRIDFSLYFNLHRN